MKFFLLLTYITFAGFPVCAQVQPNDQTTELVASYTVTLFEQLFENDYGGERALLAKELSILVSKDDWRDNRQVIIDEAGSAPQYTAHGLTYYQNQHLLAAVDFSGQATNQGFFVCGYALWKLSDAETIGLTRLEENVVSIELFRGMPLQEAAQTLTNWRCPTAVIEFVLGVSVE